MTEFGDELHRRLEERGISLREAARRAGCSAGYLSNASHGRKPLTPNVAARLDRVLGTGDTFAAHALNPEQEAGSPAVEPARQRPASTPRRDRPRRDDGQREGNAAGVRRESPPLAVWAATTAEAKLDANRLWHYDLDQSGTPAGTATAAASAILSWLTALPDGTAANAAGDREISRHDAKRVRAVRAWLKDLDNAHGGGVAFPLATAYLRGEVATLLRGSCDEVTGTTLLAAIAETELDTGWFAYDAGDHQLARIYLIHALRMAHAAGSRLLGARIVCAMSHQALHVGQVSLSVDLARAARAGAGPEATPRATAMLAAMEAMAHAGARDAARSGQALEDAERALTHATADDGDPDWLDFDEGGLLGHTARALRDLAAVTLAAPDDARYSAARSVELCRAGHGRTRAQRNAILATTCVQAGDIDQAAAIGELIIADAWELQSRHVQSDIAALLASIEPTRSRSASAFSEQAREFLTAWRSPAAPAPPSL
jgi:transcriptional regulator with XRE-family HTH domain